MKICVGKTVRFSALIDMRQKKKQVKVLVVCWPYHAVMRNNRNNIKSPRTWVDFFGQNVSDN